MRIVSGEGLPGKGGDIDLADGDRKSTLLNSSHPQLDRKSVV